MALTHPEGRPAPLTNLHLFGRQTTDEMAAYLNDQLRPRGTAGRTTDFDTCQRLANLIPQLERAYNAALWAREQLAAAPPPEDLPF